MKKLILILILFFGFNNLYSQEYIKLDSVNFRYNNSTWLGWTKCNNKFKIYINESSKEIKLYNKDNILKYNCLYSVENKDDINKNISIYAIDTNYKDVIITIWYIKNIRKYINIMYLHDNFEISYILKNNKKI